MIISIITAMDQERGIGIENQMPWHLPLDLKRFKKITLGHYLILGRKTFQSIGKPLPGRQMIILSRNPAFTAKGCEVSGSFSEALQIAEAAGEQEVFVVGGGEIYQEALTLVDRLYLTTVDTVAEADTYFPPLDLKAWSEICQHHFPADDQNPISHTFRYLVRV
jgi:dihydrofolate reductase